MPRAIQLRPRVWLRLSQAIGGLTSAALAVWTLEYDPLVALVLLGLGITWFSLCHELGSMQPIDPRLTVPRPEPFAMRRGEEPVRNRRNGASGTNPQIRAKQLPRLWDIATQRVGSHTHVTAPIKTGEATEVGIVGDDLIG